MAKLGVNEAIEQIFESKNSEAASMRKGLGYLVVIALLTMLLAPIAASEGRAAPTCQTYGINSIPSIIDVVDGSCVIVELGQLESGSVHEFEFIVVDDALDILFFDENSIQGYQLGQSYRASFDQTTSTESANGSLEFHWQVPASISPKEWFIVLDNLAHDGDGGQGDQGGTTSKVGLEWQMSSDSYWTPFHTLVKVNPDDFHVLLTPNDAQFDAGTVVVISMWGLEGVGDLFIQTTSMHSTYTNGEVGVQYVTGGAIQGVDNTASLTYVIPSDLDGQGLYFILDNSDTPLGGGDGSTLLRSTVRIELSPPLSPVLDVSSTLASTDEQIDFSAQNTPNALGQIESYSWDFDHLTDTNGDGNFTNDVNAVGLNAQTSWSMPGTKVVTLTALSVDGRSTSVSANISVQDNQAPNAIIASSAVWVNTAFNQLWGQSAIYSCLESSDNIGISACEWNLDGESLDENVSLTLSWTSIGTHTLQLIVYDDAMNQDNASITINIIDTSTPIISNASLDALPSKATLGQAQRFQTEVFDEYDDLGQLRIHWDVNPSFDADSNGNPRDDADYLGFNPQITFEKTGLQDVVLTVFDASNNSVSHAFAVNVEVAETVSSNTAQMVFTGLLVLIALGGIGIFSFRLKQQKQAKLLLMERGLPEEEALLRIEMVRQKRKVSPFSSAEYIAGLDLGEVQTQAAMEEEQRRKEIEDIYGTSPPPPSSESTMQASMYQPQQSTTMYQAQSSLSAAASAVASEAADLLGVQIQQPVQTTQTQTIENFEDLFEDDDDEPSSFESTDVFEQSMTRAEIQTSKVSLPDAFIVSSTPTPKSVQEPVSTPQPEDHQQPQVEEKTTRKVVHQCTECSIRFEIDVPSHLTRVLVECPSCHQDQTLG
jgi:hypothetical protein